ncbi:hypothetical protein CBF34_08560 [Vagococcus penaei]|uniref:Uncharacterized protein n=1 Tax=Vagococcus penaei TaxID=633807 RepID=A0A1Q2D5S1_9ENTE|nr:hypothetical protein [Vagococcus penaei]AQP53739.1 hypothetical protein BW732_05465 [Vagococcus penaei]RSU00430.1 hypothetical protein CBF34_08560 [Vagococcus penaei]
MKKSARKTMSVVATLLMSSMIFAQPILVSAEETSQINENKAKTNENSDGFYEELDVSQPAVIHERGQKDPVIVTGGERQDTTTVERAKEVKSSQPSQQSTPQVTEENGVNVTEEATGVATPVEVSNTAVIKKVGSHKQGTNNQQGKLTKEIDQSIPNIVEAIEFNAQALANGQLQLTIDATKTSQKQIVKGEQLTIAYAYNPKYVTFGLNEGTCTMLDELGNAVGEVSVKNEKVQIHVTKVITGKATIHLKATTQIKQLSSDLPSVTFLLDGRTVDLPISHGTLAFKQIKLSYPLTPQRATRFFDNGGSWRQSIVDSRLMAYSYYFEQLTALGFR